MGLCQAAGFFGIVYKIRLTELFGMISDDLDGVVVCANCSVEAKSLQFAVDRISTAQLLCFLHIH